eukprot:gene9779-13156_t
MSAKESKGSASNGKGGISTLVLVGLFVIWYGFNASYNIYNAYLKVFAYPITISILQLAVGLFYAIPLWILGIRKPPSLNFNDIIRILPIAILNALGHSVTVIAMFQKGGGSFTHVIKASEPVVSAVLGILINGIFPKPLTAISLLPITYGVAYASTLGKLDVATMSRELTTLTSVMAMIGNISFALRSIIRKNLTSDFKLRTNLDANNDIAVTTILSILLVLPFAIIFEDPVQVLNSYNNMPNKESFLLNVFICGMSFYIYNEVQNTVLASLGPVPTAVGNTLKRVVIFVALYFCTEGETFPYPKILGCAIAVAGCLAFAVFDSKKL